MKKPHFFIATIISLTIVSFLFMAFQIKVKQGISVSTITHQGLTIVEDYKDKNYDVRAIVDDSDTIKEILLYEDNERTVGIVFFGRMTSGRNKLLQTIDFSELGLSVKVNDIQFIDVNFDEFTDICVKVKLDADNYQNISYLYNPQTKQFDYNKEFSVLYNPIYNVSDLSIYTKNESADKLIYSAYRYFDNKLIKVRELEAVADNSQSTAFDNYTITYKELRNGEWSDVKNWQNAVERLQDNELWLRYKRYLFSPFEETDDKETSYYVLTNNFEPQTSVIECSIDKNSKQLKLAIYQTDELFSPIQLIAERGGIVVPRIKVVDFNFDGYLDIICPLYYEELHSKSSFWRWDKNAKRFVKGIEFAENYSENSIMAALSSEIIYSKEQVIVSRWLTKIDNGYLSLYYLYRYVDGKLTCQRAVEEILDPTDDKKVLLRVRDYQQGEWKMIENKNIDLTDNETIIDEPTKWIVDYLEQQ